MSVAEKEIDNSKVDEKNLPLTPDEKEIDNSKVDKKNLLFTPAERMVEVYNEIDDSSKKKNL